MKLKSASESSKAKKISKKKLTRYIVTALFIILAVYCSIVLVNNYSDISKLKAQAAEDNVKYEQQIEDNDEVKAVLNSKDKDKYIEKKAREKGYAKEGETVFYDISSSK